ncbi:hypothetical protein KAU11_05360 [Candidatus Babeliales bacterium]|nr:hypothetical protein [Candidatus Babeliales bacterium]
MLKIFLLRELEIHEKIILILALLNSIQVKSSTDYVLVGFEITSALAITAAAIQLTRGYLWEKKQQHKNPLTIKKYLHILFDKQADHSEIEKKRNKKHTKTLWGCTAALAVAAFTWPAIIIIHFYPQEKHLKAMDFTHENNEFDDRQLAIETADKNIIEMQDRVDAINGETKKIYAEIRNNNRS